LSAKRRLLHIVWPTASETEKKRNNEVNASFMGRILVAAKLHKLFKT
jgi:hypothetical protein